MYLKVQYLREINHSPTECWSFVSLTQDIAEAMTDGRDGQGGARMHFGATSFRVVDNAGLVLGFEEMPANAGSDAPLSERHQTRLLS